MPRRRWIKLWTQESLYGSISRELDPDERWAWIGLLLLAGDSIELGKVCAAPRIPWTDKQIADILQIPESTWLAAKEKMLLHEKIENHGGILSIVNWDKYQGEFDKAEYMRDYMREYRKTMRKTNSKTVNSKATNCKTVEQTRPEGRGGEQSTITTATTSENLAKIAKLYEDNISRLTSVIGERLKDIADKYPAGWFEEALKEALGLEHRNLKYIEAILERWKVEGFKAPKKLEGGKGGTHKRSPRQLPARDSYTKPEDY